MHETCTFLKHVYAIKRPEHPGLRGKVLVTKGIMIGVPVQSAYRRQLLQAKKAKIEM
jgi:hypothetical protein